MVDQLVPQVYIQFDFLSFHKHSSANIIGLEDEHPPFSTMPLRDDRAFFFDEVTFGDPRDMQEIPHYQIDLFGCNPCTTPRSVS